MKPRGFPGELPSLVAKFLRLAGVAAVLSNVEFVGRSGAFNPLFDSSLVPVFIKQYTKNILMIMIMVGSASYSLVERRSDDGGRPNGRPTHKIRWIFLKPINHGLTLRASLPYLKCQLPCEDLAYTIRTIKTHLCTT